MKVGTCRRPLGRRGTGGTVGPWLSRLGRQAAVRASPGTGSRAASALAFAQVLELNQNRCFSPCTRLLSPRAPGIWRHANKRQGRLRWTSYPPGGQPAPIGLHCVVQALELRAARFPMPRDANDAEVVVDGAFPPRAAKTRDGRTVISCLWCHLARRGSRPRRSGQVAGRPGFGSAGQLARHHKSAPVNDPGGSTEGGTPRLRRPGIGMQHLSFISHVEARRSKPAQACAEAVKRTAGDEMLCVPPQGSPICTRARMRGVWTFLCFGSHSPNFPGPAQKRRQGRCGCPLRYA